MKPVLLVRKIMKMHDGFILLPLNIVRGQNFTHKVLDEHVFILLKKEDWPNKFKIKARI